MPPPIDFTDPATMGGGINPTLNALAQAQSSAASGIDPSVARQQGMALLQQGLQPENQGIGVQLAKALSVVLPLLAAHGKLNQGFAAAGGLQGLQTISDQDKEDARNRLLNGLYLGQAKMQEATQQATRQAKLQDSSAALQAKAAEADTITQRQNELENTRFGHEKQLKNIPQAIGDNPSSTLNQFLAAGGTKEDFLKMQTQKGGTTAADKAKSNEYAKFSQHIDSTIKGSGKLQEKLTLLNDIQALTKTGANSLELKHAIMKLPSAAGVPRPAVQLVVMSEPNSLRGDITKGFNYVTGRTDPPITANQKTAINDMLNTLRARIKDDFTKIKARATSEAPRFLGSYDPDEARQAVEDVFQPSFDSIGEAGGVKAPPSNKINIGGIAITPR